MGRYMQQQQSLNTEQLQSLGLVSLDRARSCNRREKQSRGGEIQRCAEWQPQSSKLQMSSLTALA